MFTFDKSDLQRFTVSAVGALALATASVFAAVAPVKASTPQATTVAEWTGIVERQLDSGIETSRMSALDTKVRHVTLQLDFTAEGDFARAAIMRSSGNKLIDASALDTAGRVDYPVLPAGLRGGPQKITMNLHFARTRDAVDQVRAGKARDRQFVTRGGSQPAAG